MICAFIGLRGSGKTLSQTLEANVRYRKERLTIYSNYVLNGIKYEAYTVDDLMIWAEEGKDFTNCLLLIDELHIYFDSRTSQKKRNRIFSYLVTQSSKTNLDIYYTTQFGRQVDVRIRIHTDKIINCNAKSLIWKSKDSKPYIRFNYRPKPNEKLYKVLTWVKNEITYMNDNNDKVIVRKFFANPFFKLYNTREVIKQQNTSEEISA